MTFVFLVPTIPFSIIQRKLKLKSNFVFHRDKNNKLKVTKIMIRARVFLQLQLPICEFLIFVVYIKRLMGSLLIIEILIFKYSKVSLPLFNEKKYFSFVGNLFLSWREPC